jgi:hypothetical protein
MLENEMTKRHINGLSLWIQLLALKITTIQYTNTMLFTQVHAVKEQGKMDKAVSH